MSREGSLQSLTKGSTLSLNGRMLDATEVLLYENDEEGAVVVAAIGADAVCSR
jgi:hypothetical protein